MERRQRWLLFGLFFAVLLFWNGTVRAAELSGEWKFYEAENAENQELNLVVLHSALHYDAPDWKVYDMKKKPVLAPNTRYLWLTTKLPEVAYYRNPVLFFITTEQAVRVYMDNELIYSYGEFGLYHHTYGVKWHMVALPVNYKGRQLSFQLYTDHPGRLGEVASLSINDGIQQVHQVFNYDILIWCALPMAFILFVIMVLYYQVMQQHRNLYIYLAAFLALMVGWLLAALRTNLLVFDRPAFWWHIMLFCVYSMPVFGNLLVREVILPPLRPYVLFFAGGYMLLLLCVIVGEILGYNAMDSGISIFYVWMFISQCIVTCLMVYSARKGDRTVRALLLPVVGIPALGMFDGLSSHFHVFKESFFFTPLGIFLLAFFIIWVLRENMREEQRLTELTKNLEKEMDAVNEKAQIDALTKCFNRGKLDETLEKEINIAEYTGLNLALLMFDIDLFKSVNDTYGHAAGDQVLLNFAMQIRQHLDARHVFIRYGGEEFLVFCRGYDLEQARELAEQIRQSVAEAVLLRERPITCSIGISRWHRSVGDQASDFLKRADDALYAAKHSGRNCVKTEEDRGS